MRAVVVPYTVSFATIGKIPFRKKYATYKKPVRILPVRYTKLCRAADDLINNNVGCTCHSAIAAVACIAPVSHIPAAF